MIFIAANVIVIPILILWMLWLIYDMPIISEIEKPSDGHFIFNPFFCTVSDDSVIWRLAINQVDEFSIDWNVIAYNSVMLSYQEPDTCLNVDPDR